MSVKIITDSASDITQEYAKQLGITVIPLTTTFGDVEYLDGVTISHKEFFEKLIESDVLPKTSQIPPHRYQEEFEKLEEGDTVVCIVVTSKLSGTFQSAVIAASEYEERIYTVDSENVCLGQRILVEYAVRLRDEGRTAAEIAAELDRAKKRIRLIALLDTLEYLKKGGRISKAAAIAGGLLSIKPVITIKDGLIEVAGKARGSKNGNNLLMKYVKENGGICFDMPYALAYSGLSRQLLDKYIADSSSLYDCAPEDLPVCTIGSTIGTHVGPGAVAVTFFAAEE